MDYDFDTERGTQESLWCRVILKAEMAFCRSEKPPVFVLKDCGTKPSYAKLDSKSSLPFWTEQQRKFYHFHEILLIHSFPKIQTLVPKCFVLPLELLRFIVPLKLLKFFGLSWEILPYKFDINKKKIMFYLMFIFLFIEN